MIPNMPEGFYGWLSAGSSYVIYLIAVLVIWIKFNDLPHIRERLLKLELRGNPKSRKED